MQSPSQSSPPPNRPDEITSEWISDLLADVQRSGDVEVREVELIGAGFTGVVARARLSGVVDPRSLVFKFGHADPEVRAQIWDAGIYQREAWLYSEFADQIPLTTPRCWFADSRPDDDHHVLVFDDLSELTLYDQITGCPVSAAIKIVDDLAALHARFWRTESLQGLHRADEDDAWFAVVDGCVDRTLARSDLSPSLRELTSLQPRIGREIVGRLCERPTITHADARVENVFFAPDGSRTWIDWDGIQIAGGTAELAYFMSQSLTTDVRRAIESDLLRRYHDGLVRSAVGIDYSFEELWDDYRLGVLGGWAVGMAAIGAYGELEGSAATLVSEGIGRVAAAVDDTDAMSLL